MLKYGWIKTRMDRHFTDDFLYLDVDTIVRGDVGDIFNFEGIVAGVHNHNTHVLDESIWAEDLQFLRRIGSPVKLDHYLNGGVLAFRSGRDTNKFFEDWHRTWCEGYYVTAKSLDRPALNLIVAGLGSAKCVLNDDFNRQVSVSRDRHGAARIWQFKYGQSEGTCVTRLLNAMSSLSLGHVRKAVEEIMARETPSVELDSCLHLTSQDSNLPSGGAANVRSLAFTARVNRQKACVLAGVLCSEGAHKPALAVLTSALEADIATQVFPVILEGLETISNAMEPLDPKQADMIRRKLTALRESRIA